MNDVTCVIIVEAWHVSDHAKCVGLWQRKKREAIGFRRNFMTLTHKR